MNWCAGMRVFLFVLCCFDCSNLRVDVVCDVCGLLFVLIGVLWYCMVSCDVLVVCWVLLSVLLVCGLPVFYVVWSGLLAFGFWLFTWFCFVLLVIWCGGLVVKLF